MALAGVVSGLSFNWKPTPPSGPMMASTARCRRRALHCSARPGCTSNCMEVARVNCRLGGRRSPATRTHSSRLRELCEEVGGNFFGDVDELADKLRSEAKVRILNRHGRYVTFFVKVPYAPAEMLPTVCTRTLRM